MKNYALFADASANPGLNIGVGGYLLVPDSLIENPSSLINISELNEVLVLRKFIDTSSTRIEVQTVLWALEEYCAGSAIATPGKLHVYSDSQCVAGLLPRRTRLEGSGFQCRRGNRLLKNEFLYRKYYEFHDRLAFDVTKVAGHTRSRSRDTAQTVFSFVDRKVRKALKQWVTQLEAEKTEWYVYMIRCRDGELYTGISNDVARRFEKHLEMGKQGAKYLRGRGPLTLVFQKRAGDRSSALKIEQKIKKLSKPQKENIIHKGDIE
ncbi:MAG: GIY-YIG nuclease family protein [Desulfobacterales bacterium]